ncbi:DUF2950 domain-containing protein [Microvirga flavescens]|uniref:DUF2950 domain-containing protein n=1 Tax=Microvirga flavescens TaxID=2249811 RepID=UPI000DD8C385|nr:DUF2950 domain-containing protein [Microvirga flavescens]
MSTVFLIAAVALIVMAPAANAQQSFRTPEEAADALVAAARRGDSNGMLKVLGSSGEDIVSSGDAVADSATRERFLAAFDTRHQVTVDGGKATLMVGAEDFPFPIPLVKKDGQWRFDTTAGRREIVYRRIGRNELDAIQSSLAYVDAQSDYAEKDRTGAGRGIYAQRFISSEGKKDGLYWPISKGDDPSPLGALVGLATREGYRITGERTPLRGYYYKILTRQGPAAPGGALDYVVNGKMIGGFALVAYPAEYGNSGVMTFLVSHGGKVYEKDLGLETAKIAAQMTSFNPDHTWKEVASPEQSQ